MAKFCGDRPTELGDLAKKKEASAVKNKTAGNYHSGRPNNHLWQFVMLVEL